MRRQNASLRALCLVERGGGRFRILVFIVHLPKSYFQDRPLESLQMLRG